jgi:hypothetical protein
VIAQFPRNKEEQSRIINLNNNQTFIWRRRKGTVINISFVSENESGKLIFNGIIQGPLADSAKVDKTLMYMLDHAKLEK